MRSAVSRVRATETHAVSVLVDKSGVGSLAMLATLQLRMIVTSACQRKLFVKAWKILLEICVNGFQVGLHLLVGVFYRMVALARLLEQESSLA